MLKITIGIVLVILVVCYFASLLLIPAFLYFVFHLQDLMKKISEKYSFAFTHLFLKPHEKSLIGPNLNESFQYSNADSSVKIKVQKQVRPTQHLAFREIIDILIPAHNEQDYLAQTVQSIRQSFFKAGRECRIIIGLDHCEDQTLEVASAIGDMVVSVRFESKWETLNYLTQFVKSNWVAFVDVGTIWPEELVLKISYWEAQKGVLFLAPSYQQIQSSILQKLNWELEAFLKNLENTAGGPISVHGATVFYKTAPLLRTLKLLRYKKWLNDDVIIPLVLRAQNSKGRGVYLYDVKVTDLPPKARYTQRRNRISLGNLEILEFLSQNTIKLNRVLRLLWERRKARIFWAYFLLSFVLLVGVLNSWMPLLINSMILVFLGLSFSRRVFRVSLLAPFYLFKLRHRDDANKNNFRVRWH